MESVLGVSTWTEQVPGGPVLMLLTLLLPGQLLPAGSQLQLFQPINRNKTRPRPFVSQAWLLTATVQQLTWQMYARVSWISFKMLPLATKVKSTLTKWISPKGVFEHRLTGLLTKQGGKGAA